MSETPRTVEEIARATAMVCQVTEKAAGACISCIENALRSEREAREKAEADLKAAREEIELDDKLLADRNRLLEALECDAHGPCVPGALKKVHALRDERDRLRSHRAELIDRIGRNKKQHFIERDRLSRRVEKAERAIRGAIEFMDDLEASDDPATWKNPRASSFHMTIAELRAALADEEKA